MLNIIGIVAAVIGVAIVGLLAFASTRPNRFSVTRSIVIKASTDQLFAWINDLHRFNEWNPWLRKEPNAQGTHSGPQSGVGARYAWAGSKVGSGSMTIASVVPGERITLDLAFLKPFKADNVAEFTLAPTAEGTEVTWTMRGPAPLVTKVMDVVIGMDKMIGKDFEAGLANLKVLAER